MGWGAIAANIGMGLYSANKAEEQQRDALKPSAEEKQALSQATEQAQYHNNTFKPLEKNFISQAQGLDDSSHVARLANATNATNMGGLSQGVASLNAAGVDPSSGRYQSGMGQTIGDGLAGNANDMAGAGAAARENKVGGLLNSAKLGSNINGAALQNMNTSASLATNSALNSSQNLASTWDNINATGRGFVDYGTNKNGYNTHKTGDSTNWDSFFG